MTTMAIIHPGMRYSISFSHELRRFMASFLLTHGGVRFAKGPSVCQPLTPWSLGSQQSRQD